MAIIKKLTKRFALLLFVVVTLSPNVRAQKVALKTNLLYWGAMGTANVEGEVVTGRHSSVNLMLGYNPWTFSENKKMKHISALLGYRYWFCQPMNGSFIGVQGEYAHFNAGNLHFPLSIWKNLRDERLQGNMVALGVSYGYHFVLSRHWSLETEIGLGLAYAKYGRYPCYECGPKLGNGEKLFLKPTRAAMSVVYLF